MSSSHQGLQDLAPLSNVVGDLIHGYDALVGNLPHVADKVIEMHSATEGMAKQLEERMRYLVDGYEYLDSISSQIPESLRETAAAHKRGLLEATEILMDQDKVASRPEQYGEIERLKAELHSIAHERVVVDVLMRQAAIKPSRCHPSSQQSRQPKSSGVSRRSAGPASGDISANKGSVFQPIPLPTYFPGAGAALTSTLSAADQQNNDPNQLQGTGTAAATAAQSAGRKVAAALRAKAVGDGLLVPAMRSGAIPEELLGLKTVPTMVAGGSAAAGTLPSRKKRASLRDALALDMIGRELRAEVDRTQSELKSLKSQLANAGARNEREKKMSREQLELLARAIRDQEKKVTEATTAAVAAAAAEMRQQEGTGLEDEGNNYDDIARLLVQSRLPYTGFHPTMYGTAPHPTAQVASTAAAAAAPPSSSSTPTPSSRVVLVDPALLTGYRVLTVGGGKNNCNNKPSTTPQKTTTSNPQQGSQRGGAQKREEPNAAVPAVQGLGQVSTPQTTLGSVLSGGGGIVGVGSDKIIEVVGGTKPDKSSLYDFEKESAYGNTFTYSNFHVVNPDGTPAVQQQSSQEDGIPGIVSITPPAAAVSASSHSVPVPNTAAATATVGGSAGTASVNSPDGGGVTKIVVETSGLERPNGVEKELLQLLQTVVYSQQATLQGNQELLLDLLRGGRDRAVFEEEERGVGEESREEEKNRDKDEEEKEEEVAEIPAMQEVPVSTVPPPPHYIVEEAPAPQQRSIQPADHRQSRQSSEGHPPGTPQRLFRTQFGKTFLVNKDSSHSATNNNNSNNNNNNNTSNTGNTNDAALVVENIEELELDYQPGVLAAKQQLPVAGLAFSDTAAAGGSRTTGGGVSVSVSSNGAISMGYRPHRGSKPVSSETLEAAAAGRDRVTNANAVHSGHTRSDAAAGRYDPYAYPSRAQTYTGAGTAAIPSVQMGQPSAVDIAMNLANAIGSLATSNNKNNSGINNNNDSSQDGRAHAAVTRREITAAVEEGVRKAIQLVHQEGLREAQEAFTDRTDRNGRAQDQSTKNRAVDFGFTSGPTGLLHADGTKKPGSSSNSKGVGAEGGIVNDILGSRRAVSEMRTQQRTGDDSLSVSGDRDHFWACENHDNLHDAYHHNHHNDHNGDADSDDDDMVDVIDYERGTVIGRNGELLSDDEYDAHALNTGFRFKRGSLYKDVDASADADADVGEYTQGVNYGKYFRSANDTRAPRSRSKQTPLSIPRPRGGQSREWRPPIEDHRRRKAPGPAEGENWHDDYGNDEIDSVGSGSVKYKGVAPSSNSRKSDYTDAGCISTSEYSSTGGGRGGGGKLQQRALRPDHPLDQKRNNNKAPQPAAAADAIASLRPFQLTSKVLEYENTEIVQGIEDASLLGSDIFEDEDEAIAPSSLLSRRDRLRHSQAPSLSSRHRYDNSYDDSDGENNLLRVRGPRPMDPHYIARHGEDLAAGSRERDSRRAYTEKAHLHKNTPDIYGTGTGPGTGVGGSNKTALYKHTAYPYGAYEYFYEDSEEGGDHRQHPDPDRSTRHRASVDSGSGGGKHPLHAHSRNVPVAYAGDNDTLSDASYSSSQSSSSSYSSSESYADTAAPAGADVDDNDNDNGAGGEKTGTTGGRKKEGESLPNDHSPRPDVKGKKNTKKDDDGEENGDQGTDTRQQARLTYDDNNFDVDSDDEDIKHLLEAARGEGKLSSGGGPVLRLRKFH